MPEGVELWYRNSLYFDNLSSYRSDIDLTLLAENDTQLVVAIERLRILKTLIPIIGESNCYLQTDLNKLAPIANSFEISRDPILFSRLNTQLSKSNEEKIVFISRMLLANKHSYLKDQFNSNKWSWYFTHIGETEPKNFKDILDFLDKNNFDELESDSCLNPVPFIADALERRAFPEYLKEVSKLSSKAKMLLLYNLKWELFGVSSQKHSTNSKIQINNHFRNIEQVLIALNLEQDIDINSLCFDIPED